MATTRTRDYQGVQIPEAGTDALDQGHTTIEFVGRHLMITKVRGRFHHFDGRIAIGGSPYQSSVEVSINTASVDSSDEKRDGHLRSPDFLDVENYPTITFRTPRSTSATTAWPRSPETLTVKDVSRPVTLDVEFDGAQVDP